MSIYRKLPVEIEAIQWQGRKSWGELVDNLIKCKADFEPFGLYTGDESEELAIGTLEGRMKVSVGDYVIRGVNGEFYPCKPDIFEKTYELVS